MKSGDGVLTSSNISTTVDYSVTYSSQSALDFPNLTLISGNFFFVHNAATTVKFPVLSTVVGNFVVAFNTLLLTFQAASLTSTGIVSIFGNNPGLAIALSSLYQVLCEGGSGTTFADLRGCTRITYDRRIALSSATIVVSALLTLANGYLYLQSNSVLATIHLPALSAVRGYLSIQSHPFLTLVHLPKLTFIGDRLFFCENNAAFRIPSGPPDAPTGGLVVTSSHKNQAQCYVQQGSDFCNGAYVTCP
jgi:hypothetical protein